MAERRKAGMAGAGVLRVLGLMGAVIVVTASIVLAVASSDRSTEATTVVALGAVALGDGQRVEVSATSTGSPPTAYVLDVTGTGRGLLTSRITLGRGHQVLLTYERKNGTPFTAILRSQATPITRSVSIRDVQGDRRILHTRGGVQMLTRKGNPSIAFERAKLWHVDESSGLADPPPADAAGRLVYGTYHELPVSFLRVGADELQNGTMVRDRVQKALSRGREIHRETRECDDGQVDEAGGAGPPRCVREREALHADPEDLTIVIPTRDRSERLQRCLESIASLRYPLDRITVIVVDNASQDDATRRVTEGVTSRLNVRYLREEQSGSASARNRALPEVRTPLVAFTDDDAIVDPLWLSELVRTFRSKPYAAAVTGLLLPHGIDTRAQSLFEEWGGFSRGFLPEEYNLDRPHPESPLYPYTAGVYGTGNNMAFRTAALLEIGGFCNSLGNGTPALGGVDSEVLLRTVLLGKTIIYQPTALVWHEHRREYRALQSQLFNYGAGMTAFLLKTVLDDPRRLLAITRRVPAGIHFALSGNSTRNENRSHLFPGSSQFARCSAWFTGRSPTLEVVTPMEGKRSPFAHTRRHRGGIVS